MGTKTMEKKIKTRKKLSPIHFTKIIPQIAIILFMRAFKTIAFTQKCHS